MFSLFDLYIDFFPGLDAFAYDPHKYAMDYHGMGFRECVAEVIRYLERIEGLDVQNPLRLRLTSHLQCCAAQRELASKQATTAPWGYGASQPYPLWTPFRRLRPPTTVRSPIWTHTNLLRVYITRICTTWGTSTFPRLARRRRCHRAIPHRGWCRRRPCWRPWRRQRLRRCPTVRTSTPWIRSVFPRVVTIRIITRQIRGRRGWSLTAPGARRWLTDSVDRLLSARASSA